MLINLSDRQEDYLREILELVEEKGPTKIRDISTNLGVSPASAVQMMWKLNEKKQVVYKKYGGVSEVGDSFEALHQVLYVGYLLELA